MPDLHFGKSEYIEREAIHAWFGLTYANYLVVPRSVLQSMPDEWQTRFVTCLNEMHDAYGHLDWPEYRVNAVDSRGRFKRDAIPHYNRGRTRLEPDVLT
jgi:hypothetical protein